QDAQARRADPLPEPVDTTRAAPADPAAATSVATAPSSATAAGAGDGSRYLLQAGAFKASGQAEELKARIALLGLGARVEAAQIDDTTVYRVRMGPYGTATDLAEAKRKLSGGGLESLAIKVK
ncbi:SPOR domain-containing protein, partial [Lysobacter sp. A3-1-A15]